MVTARHQTVIVLSAALMAALLATGALMTAAPAQAEDDGAITDIALTIGSDETQVNVAWYTPEEVPGRVQWAPASASDGDTFPETAVEAATSDDGQTHDGRHYHHATMDGLEASTDYVYRVGDGREWSSTFGFTTGTADAADIEFLVMGDPQLGSSGDTASDGQGWEATLETALEMFPGTTWVHSLGDQVEDADSEQQYAALLSPSALREVPFAFTLGNHDLGDLAPGDEEVGSTAFATHFFMPGVDSSVGYHWYRYGDVLVMGLDSNSLDAEEHESFIEQVLADQGGETTWRIVTFHHSAFGLAEHSQAAEIVEFRETIAPVLSEHGIDVAFMGHDHTYARTHLMSGREPVASQDPDELHAEEGQTLYLTLNSASGSKYYPIAPDEQIAAADPQGFDFAEVTWQEEVPSFTHVTISGDAMTIATHRTDTREAYDEVVLHRAGAPQPSPSASPSPSTPSDSPRPASAPEADADENEGVPAWVLIAAVVAILALALAGAVAVLRRRDSGDQES